MDNDSIFQIIFILLLIISSAFFSSAETALISCNKLRIQTLAKDGNKKAALLDSILNNQAKMICTILIGNNIANIGASALSTSLALKLFGNYAISITTGLLTLIVLICGEIIPKNIATIHANTISLLYAPIIKLLMIILTPIVILINFINNFLIKLFIHDNDKTNTITEQELKTLIDVGEKEGVLEKSEKIIINNLLEFTDDRAKEIMTPRIDMIFVNINDDYSTIMKIFSKYHFTRLPVFDLSKDEVVGILNMKDLLFVDPNEFSIKDYLREAHFTFETKQVGSLLIEMQNTNISMVIVLDEYGITSGLITLEDLLEELVGEIRDEYDYDEIDEIVKLSDIKFLVNPMTKINDINDYFNLSINENESDTIAGYIMSELDHIPKKNEYIEISNYKFTITKFKNNRILELTVKKE